MKALWKWRGRPWVLDRLSFSCVLTYLPLPGRPRRPRVVENLVLPKVFRDSEVRITSTCDPSPRIWKEVLQLIRHDGVRQWKHCVARSR